MVRNLPGCVASQGRSFNGVLEFKAGYTNGDDQWNHIELIKNEEPHTTASYIIINDLGTILNMPNGRWARLFLRSLKIILRRLRHSEFPGFEATTCNPSPTSKKQRSLRYAKN